MKFSHTGKWWRPCQLAFSLTEVLIASSLMTVVVTGVVYSHITGTKLFQLAKTKLGANDQARAAVAYMVNEVRSCLNLKLGNTGSGLTNFTACTNGQSYQGNALQLFPTTNNSQYVQYAVRTNSGIITLVRSTNGSVAFEKVAEYLNVTNTYVFTMENFSNTVVTAKPQAYTIGVKLSFYQLQYPITKVGTNQYYDRYEMLTKITPRVPSD